jgi:hypothetical protein
MGVADALRGFLDWREPRDGIGDNPFRLACSFEPPTSPSGELSAVWGGRELPSELVELWTSARSARLFEDIDYGQWGLVLLSPPESADRTALELAERPGDFAAGDIVIGEFLGDQELLVHTPTGILVALPLDPRSDWDVAADNLEEFLRRYLDAHGDKYWEKWPTAD